MFVLHLHSVLCLFWYQIIFRNKKSNTLDPADVSISTENLHMAHSEDSLMQLLEHVMPSIQSRELATSKVYTSQEPFTEYQSAKELALNLNALPEEPEDCALFGSEISERSRKQLWNHIQRRKSAFDRWSKTNEHASNQSEKSLAQYICQIRQECGQIPSNLPSEILTVSNATVTMSSQLEKDPSSKEKTGQADKKTVNASNHSESYKILEKSDAQLKSSKSEDGGFKDENCSDIDSKEDNKRSGISQSDLRNDSDIDIDSERKKNDRESVDGITNANSSAEDEQKEMNVEMLKRTLERSQSEPYFSAHDQSEMKLSLSASSLGYGLNISALEGPPSTIPEESSCRSSTLNSIRSGVGSVRDSFNTLKHSSVNDLQSPRQLSMQQKGNLEGRIKSFVGRDDILDTIASLTDSSNAVLLRGKEGVGKRSVVNEYAYRNEEKYSSLIFRFNAQNANTFLSSAAELSVHLELDKFQIDEPLNTGNAKHKHLKDARCTVWTRILLWLKANSGWLLVFEDVSSQEQMASFLPLIGEMKSLIAIQANTDVTSNDWSGFSIINVSEFSQNEAQAIVAMRTLIEKETESNGDTEKAKEEGAPLSKREAKSQRVDELHKKNIEKLHDDDLNNVLEHQSTNDPISFDQEDSSACISEINNLCQLLEYHPLSLAVASSFLSKSGISAAGLCTNLRNLSSRKFTLTGNTQQPRIRVLEALCEILLSWLRQHEVVTLDILCFLLFSQPLETNQ